MSENKLKIKTLLEAGHKIGLSSDEIAYIVGLRNSESPENVVLGTEAETRALQLIGCYRCLYALMGGSPTNMVHWVRTENRHIGGIPAEMMTEPDGLKKVSDYLAAMCNR